MESDNLSFTGQERLSLAAWRFSSNSYKPLVKLPISVDKRDSETDLFLIRARLHVLTCVLSKELIIENAYSLLLIKTRFLYCSNLETKAPGHEKVPLS